MRTCHSTFSPVELLLLLPVLLYIFPPLSLKLKRRSLLVLCVCCDRSDSQADLFIKHSKMPRVQTGDGRFMPGKPPTACLSNNVFGYLNPPNLPRLFIYMEMKTFC